MDFAEINDGLLKANVNVNVNRELEPPLPPPWNGDLKLTYGGVAHSRLSLTPL